MLNPNKMIFSSKSPVTQGNEPTPEYMPLDELKNRHQQMKCRLKEALKVRKDMDEVYSKGYFENHYPKADRRLKELLSQRANLAISRMDNYEKDNDSEEKKGFQLTIKVGD